MARLGRFSVATEYFYVATELAKARRNYVATELARVERIYVATKDFIVATELATTESSTAHDRDGRAKAGVHDSVALCCVATKEAMRARQALGVYDRDAHNKGIISRQRILCRDKLGQ